MKLLLIGDERKNRRMFAWGFSTEAYDVKMASSRDAVAKLLKAESFQAVCADLKMQEDDAMAILDHLHRQAPELPIVALVGERPRKPDSFLKEMGVRAQIVTPFAIATLHTALSAQALPDPAGAP